MFFQTLLWPSERKTHCPLYVRLLFRDMFYQLTSWAVPDCAPRVMVLIEPWVPEISPAVCANVVPWKTVKMKSGKKSVGGKGASNWRRSECLNMRRQACLLERLTFSLFIFEMTWNGKSSDNRQRWCCFSECNYGLKPAVIEKRFIDFTLARHVMNCVYLMCAREVMSCNCTWRVHVWTWFTHAHQRFWLIYFDEIQASSCIKVIDLFVSDRCSTGGGGGGGMDCRRVEECTSCWTCSW